MPLHLRSGTPATIADLCLSPCFARKSAGLQRLAQDPDVLFDSVAVLVMRKHDSIDRIQVLPKNLNLGRRLSEICLYQYGNDQWNKWAS